MSTTLPLVFACSGCSNAGELADRIARELNRRELAEMSCLAGVGAEKPMFLKKLLAREVWIIDGCPIECSLGVFSLVRGKINIHLRLHDFGVRKNAPPLSKIEFEQLLEALLCEVDRQKRAATGMNGDESLNTP